MALLRRPLSYAAFLILLLSFLAACAAPAAAPTPTITAPTVAVPTVLPPTPSPSVARVATGVSVGGVDLGGLTAGEAQQKLADALVPLTQPLTVQAGRSRLKLDPQELRIQMPVDAMVDAALAAPGGSQLDVKLSYDTERLRAALSRFNAGLEAPAVSVITATGMISRSFAVTPGERFDLGGAVTQVDQHLRRVGGDRMVPLVPVAPPAPPVELLRQQVSEMASMWRGIAAVYVYDLQRDEELAAVNPDTVFSGASIMKVPILLHTYLELPSLTSEQQEWARKMVLKSDNLTANKLLAASVGGTSTEEALEGVRRMSEQLRGLGLQHTYQTMPFEAGDYLIGVRKLDIPRGPRVEGPEPHTEADPYLRTTPAEISRIFLWIDQCSRGSGVVIEQFASKIDATRCKEMLGLLEAIDDPLRLPAGLPPGTRIAHKAGWTEDMQADVGIVRSPGGDFLIAVYLYRRVPNGYLADEVAAPVIDRFARVVYTFFNPVTAP